VVQCDYSRTVQAGQDVASTQGGNRIETAHCKSTAQLKCWGLYEEGGADERKESRRLVEIVRIVPFTHQRPGNPTNHHKQPQNKKKKNLSFQPTTKNTKKKFQNKKKPNPHTPNKKKADASWFAEYTLGARQLGQDGPDTVTRRGPLPFEPAAPREGADEFTGGNAGESFFPFSLVVLPRTSV